MTLSEQAVLEFVRKHPDASRSQIRAGVAPRRSEATVWRTLKRLVEQGALTVAGLGPATRYRLADAMRIRAHLETPYHQRAPVGHRRAFLDGYVPGDSWYLDDAQRARAHSVWTNAATGV